MARNRKPAHLLTGHTNSKSHMEACAKLEAEMIGDKDVVYEVPDHLDEFAQVYYKYLVKNLESSKIPISNLDKPLIEIISDCLSKIYQCQLNINENGLTYNKTHGGNITPTPNAHVKIQQDYMTKYVQLSSRLGLDPSARATIAATQIEQKQEEADPVLQLIKELKD